MHSQRSFGVSPLARWICFIVLIAGATIWATNRVLARAGRMKTTDTPAQAFSTAAPGTRLEAVVRIDQVDGQNLKCTPLETINETTFRRTDAKTLSAALMLGTSFIMGKAQDVAPGAIVQLAGTVNADHVLSISRVVILTGYVRLVDDAQPPR